MEKSVFSYIVLFSTMLISCRSVYNKKTYIESYKLDSFRSCISEGLNNKIYDSILLSKDASFYYDGFNLSTNKKIDSIGRLVGKKAPTTPSVLELSDKKMIHYHCLKFYNSNELKNQAINSWKKNKF